MRSKLYWPVFATIAILIFSCNTFPALYGDEYGSLREADSLDVNVHAIGYFAQLHWWKMVSGNDHFLRLLSLIWMVLGLYWLGRWLAAEQLPEGARRLIMVLGATNAFLWPYAVQVRFYSFFFASTILACWRFRRWQEQPNPRNSVVLIASTVLLCTSHLFGWLVLGILVLSWLWTRYRDHRAWLVMCVLVSVAIITLSPVRRLGTLAVCRLSNSYSPVPDSSVRGLSLAMVAKVPMTFFFFTMGERVYPMWVWLTVPAGSILLAAFVLGIQQLRGYRKLGVLAGLMLLSVALVFLVLDPIAPPSLQGAAPRYVIYALPAFLLIVGLGAMRWRPLIPSVIAVQLAGLVCLLWPHWSYGGLDYMDWPNHLKRAVAQPQDTCIVTDGRSREPAERYALSGSKIVDRVEDCLSYPTILLMSNDFRLEMTRPLDEAPKSLKRRYDLVSNVTVFPAQITVYERSATGLTTLAPGRLGLPEQDLRLPLEVFPEHWKIEGFVRLDENQPVVQMPAPLAQTPSWIATNYRSDLPVAPGAPVAAIRFRGPSGEVQESILRAGLQTAAWDGACQACRALASWTKRVHLVGSRAYPGAHRQFRATIWATLAPELPWSVTSVEVRSLLERGTVYFWGVYPIRAAAGDRLEVHAR